MFLFSGLLAAIWLTVLSDAVHGASVPFQGRLDGSPVSYQIDPGKRIIFGDILAVEMRKRSSRGRDMVRVTATDSASGAVVYSKRFALSGPRHIVFIDGFALGRSSISLCVDSSKLSARACYTIDVERVE
ncbi:MAG: hypothetical protein AAF940_02810 [Pseudomonadota bacterium]